MQIHHRATVNPLKTSPKRDIFRPALDLDKSIRASLLRQKPAILWFTGLSGAGKSTIANLVCAELHLLGKHTYLLDGDILRGGINSDLGFTDDDRIENIRRTAEVAKLMVDAGLIVLAALISPFQAERLAARNLFAKGEFFEIYVDVPLELAEIRDPKGLYVKARKGEILNFTGVSSRYEPPLNPEIWLDATGLDINANVKKILATLSVAGFLE